MKFFKTLFVGTFTLLVSNTFYSQNTLIFDGEVQMCDGVFVDDGDGGPYTEEDYTFTICPDNPGDAVSIEFVAFLLETNPNPNNSDYLSIYDGPDATANSLGDYTGGALQGLPVTATVNNPTGCLTFVFQSTGTNTGCGGGGCPGWEGLISCTTPCDPPTSASAIMDPDPIDPDIQSVGVCIGQTIEFADVGSVAGTGFTLEEWNWDYDDGTIDVETSGGSVFHTFDEPGEYIVNLSVIDNNGCASLNVQPLQVLVSTIPIFNAVSTSPLCVGSPGFIDGNPVQSVTWTALPPQVVAGETYLADGAGFSYSSDLNFDFFDDGATLEDCDDLLSVSLNIEHSYLGDLAISIQCPDGTLVDILTFPNGGGGCFLGEAVDDGTNLPGTGYNYGWSPNPDIGTNIDNADNWTMTAYTDNGGNAMNNNIVNPGIYTPEGDLCDLVGCPLNGTWTISILDNLAIDNGYIFEWGLNFNPALIPGVTTFTPVIGLGLDSSYWTGPGIVSQQPNLNYADIVLDEPGFYDYTFEVTNNFSCTFDTTVTVEVIQGPENAFTAGEDKIFCQDPVQLEGALTGSGDSPCSTVSGSYSHCYTNNDNTIYSYCPDNPGDGTMLSISFSQGGMEAGWDMCTIYDGPNATGGILGTLDANFTGEVFTATNPDGCISIQFTSDGWTSCEDAWMPMDEVIWCISCGGDDVCGYDFLWEPADFLDDPALPQPFVTDFSGIPTEYVLFVSPVGFDNCASTDTVLVVPGFDYSISEQQPSCLANDGLVQVEINESPTDGPFTIELYEGATLLETEQFDGTDYVNQTLFPGNYSINVYDDIGCSYSYDFVIEDPVPMEIIAGPDAVICLSASVALEAWSNTQNDDTWVYNWINSLTGDTVTTNDGSFVATPNSSTIYTVYAEDPNGCPSGEETINVNVLGEIFPDIVGTDFICSGEEAQLDASGSFGGSGSGYTYSWIWEGNPIGTASGVELSNAPPSTGEYCVIVNDDCETPPASACMDVTIETPIQVDFEADTTEACGTGAFAFTNLVDPSLITTSIWTFGDEQFAAELNTNHIYANPGFYDVGLTVTSLVGGCEYEAVKESYINIYPLPDVGFYANPQPARVPNTTITFDGVQSENVISWLWTFNTYNPLGFSIEEDPVFTFPYDVGGFYPVTLTVEDVFGCTSSVTREIEIRDIFNLYIPSSFTPNNDGTNDAFFVYGSDIDPDKFELEIYNRWGELVFKTIDMNQPWIGNNGVASTPDYYVPNGTYTYRVEVHSLSEEAVRKEVFGHVMLIR